MRQPTVKALLENVERSQEKSDLLRDIQELKQNRSKVSAELRDKFQRLIAVGNPVMIKYHGGSQPGTTRRVEPISLTETHLRARDLVANKAKLFSLDKLEIVEDDTSTETYVPNTKPSNRTSNLIDAFENHRQALEAMGWNAIITESSIELYEKGKRRPVAALQPNYDTALSIGLEGSRVERRPSEARPWYIFGPAFSPDPKKPHPEFGQSYKYLNKAVQVFLEQAHRYSPARRARK